MDYTYDNNDNNDYDVTLEEGRVALHLLERKLKHQINSTASHAHTTTTTGLNRNKYDNTRNTSVSNNVTRKTQPAMSSDASVPPNYWTSERKILDQKPRNARLSYRNGNLGISLEKLDDRGLIDGGGTVPSYYTSHKQKSRRKLELKPRQSRIQERGNSEVSGSSGVTLYSQQIVCVFVCLWYRPADEAAVRRTIFCTCCVSS